ncbi:MAG: nucleotidyltransferase domain-containing protein [bacterium]
MNQRDYKIAQELKEKLSSVVQLVDFRVFGSRARGDKSVYSDMDVFIEVERIDKKLKEKISDITWEIGYKHLIVISPLVYTRYEIEKSPMRESPIVKNIVEEGIQV